jgi:hypothetical protein
MISRSDASWIDGFFEGSQSEQDRIQELQAYLVEMKQTAEELQAEPGISRENRGVCTGWIHAATAILQRLNNEG